MLEGCQIVDFDWRYVYINNSAARQGHSSREALLGRSMMEIYPGIETSETFSVLRDCMENRVTRQMENEFIYPDGSRGWFELGIQPVPEGIFILSLDITQRKEAEQQVNLQLQRLRALHEIDRAISSSIDMRVSLDILLGEVRDQLGVDAASILLLNPSTLMLEYVAGKGFHTSAIRQSHMHLGEGFAGQAGLERRVIHIPNLPESGENFQRAVLLKEEGFMEYFGVPLIAKAQLKGVLEIFNRAPLRSDPEWVNYMETLGGQAAIAIENAQMFEGLQHSHMELATAYDATIEGWSRAMDLRDKETEGHTLRVTELTLQLAERMGITPEQMIHIRRGALLHDIGKLGVPDHILLKPGKLTDEEWEIMRQHPIHALNMLQPIAYLRPALDIPYCHHEKWDGSGYPRGLKGEQIPLAARLFAIIDVWDALRSDRPYRAGWTTEQSRQYILEQSGKHFDPAIVEIFQTLIKNE
jgi:PAS domain S-box-containing protein/putative nucleotidyltransferase with HDIG domain